MSPPLSRPETGPAARWRPGDPDPLAEGLLGSFPARSICGGRKCNISLAVGRKSCLIHTRLRGRHWETFGVARIGMGRDAYDA